MPRIILIFLAAIGAATLMFVALIVLALSGRRKSISPIAPIAVEAKPVPRDALELYLDLMKRTLTRAVAARGIERHTFEPTRAAFQVVYSSVRGWIEQRGFEVVRLVPVNAEGYLESGGEAKNRGEDAETMIGLRQLDNLQFCITDAVARNVPGDVLEAGVWRGGASILARATLKALGENQRRVWLADSFAGLPEPDKNVDKFDWHQGDMAVSLDQVKSNFSRYGLLDEGVIFLKGFFSDTLPGARIGPLAVLRVDADLYQSTIDVLDHLYRKVSPGGYVIFDDYLNLPDCRRAIDEFRGRHGIVAAIQTIDTRAVFWQVPNA